ncbi:MAG: thiamine-phosphate kinase, partial [Coleofasciculus sp. S288]|nr:thiamine-phosphate kinase [Coleofasciculus sp. S288]
GITVGLSVTGDTLVSWVEEVYQGLTCCLQHYNTPIVGGDVVRSPVVSVAITAFGQVFPNRTIRRSAAKVGDAIVVTGMHGVSRAGLELLLKPELGQNLSDVERLHLIKAHQRPKPRLDVLPILWKILDPQSKIVRLSARRTVPLRSPNASEVQNPKSKIPIAGMDSSDGLADAVLQLCRASGVGARIERTAIPLPSALIQLVPPQLAIDWALYGGEDFELVLCLPPVLAEALVEQLGEGTAVIGNITTGNQVWLTDSSGTYADELLVLSQGFQHF